MHGFSFAPLLFISFAVPDYLLPRGRNLLEKAADRPTIWTNGADVFKIWRRKGHAVVEAYRKDGTLWSPVGFVAYVDLGVVLERAG